MLNDADLERYARQVIMPDMGEAGQEALLAAKVLVVGAGGLGAPAMLYLVSAGVGSITIIDDDMVSRSDLNRQIIYQTQDIGSQKVKQAATAARKLNPNIKLSTLPVRGTIGNIRKLVRPRCHRRLLGQCGNALSAWRHRPSGKDPSCLWRCGAHRRPDCRFPERCRRL